MADPMKRTSVSKVLLQVANHLTWRLLQVSKWPRILFRLYLSRIFNDVILSRRRTVSVGSKSGQDRVVIYVVFSPEGVQISHLHALDCISEAGYSALVVVNNSLTDADRKALLSRCWKLLERPNFGYDFGAYRDGIILLKDKLPRLGRLALLNDSIWFPLPDTMNWFVQAESMPFDCVGAASNLGVRPQLRPAMLSQEWRYDKSLPAFHLCSFLLSFSPAVLRSAEFLNFWSRLPLSNDKEWIVTRGEVTLTGELRSAGFTCTTTTPMDDLAERLRGLTDERLKQLLERLIIPEDPSLRVERDWQLSAFSPEGRRQTEAFVLYAVAETGPAYALAELAVKEMKQPFLKKSPVWKDRSGARASLAILEDVGAAVFLDEAKSMISRRGHR